ncbi:MAG TPA: Fe-S-binding domain-containing protein, partial [Terriglobales bacterium]|nr:Fe-S-binding domain-containing protein [Terriglobales bacterium]
LIITLSSIGLPLMNGFVGEFLILSGSFQAKALYGVLAASGVIWSACYMLWMYQRVFYGTVTVEANRTLPDLSGRERLALWPTAVLALVMGVASPIWINTMESSVRTALTTPQAQAAAVHAAPMAHTKSLVAGVR